MRIKLDLLVIKLQINTTIERLRNATHKEVSWHLLDQAVETLQEIEGTL